MKTGSCFINFIIADCKLECRVQIQTTRKIDALNIFSHHEFMIGTVGSVLVGHPGVQVNVLALVWKHWAQLASSWICNRRVRHCLVRM